MHRTDFDPEKIKEQDLKHFKLGTEKAKTFSTIK